MTDMIELTIDLPDEHSTIDFGARLAQSCKPPMRIYLSGELGAGKTTLSRGFIRGLGHVGSVKSPTYTLVEPYEFDDAMVFHFDLYRVADPEELAYMGFDDYLMAPALLLVEWAERGGDWLPPPDLLIHLSSLDGGRQLTLSGRSQQGNRVCQQLQCNLYPLQHPGNREPTVGPISYFEHCSGNCFAGACQHLTTNYLRGDVSSDLHLKSAKHQLILIRFSKIDD